MFGFYVGAGILNSGPRAGMVGCELAPAIRAICLATGLSLQLVRAFKNRLVYRGVLDIQKKALDV